MSKGNPIPGAERGTGGLGRLIDHMWFLGGPGEVDPRNLPPGKTTGEVIRTYLKAVDDGQGTPTRAFKAEAMLPASERAARAASRAEAPAPEPES